MIEIKIRFFLDPQVCSSNWLHLSYNKKAWCCTNKALFVVSKGGACAKGKPSICACTAAISKPIGSTSSAPSNDSTNKYALPAWSS